MSRSANVMEAGAGLAGGGHPGVPPGPPTAAGEVARQALGRDIVELLRYDLTGVLGHGPAQVHGARVAIRRLRSDLDTFHRLLDAAWVDARRTELRPVGVALAPIRHIDVFLGYLSRAAEDRPHTDADALALAGQFLDLRAEARLRLIDMLKTPWYRGLVGELARATTDLWVDPRPLADSRLPATDVLPSLLHRCLRHLRDKASALERKPGEAALDDVRVWARHCRYAAEAAMAVLGEPARRMADASQELQAALGDLNEVALCLGWLEAPPAGLAIPRHVRRSMTGILDEVAADARKAWPEALEAVLEGKAPTVTPDTARSVVGAGGVVWRGGSRLIEVVLVHRRQHRDWSLPKGTAQPGEAPAACALREVEEETGLRCRLGGELPSTAYRNQDGRRKVVRYWAMTPTSGTLTPRAEVDQARWLPISDALGVVSRARDVTVLGALRGSVHHGPRRGGGGA